MSRPKTTLRILNQMAGPMTWELAVDLGAELGRVDILTGHPDTLAKGQLPGVHLHPAKAYHRGNNFRRFASWLRYSLHSGFWLWSRERSAPVLVFSNPPLAIWTCWLLNRLCGIRYAVMVHDIYPDAVERLGILSRRNPIAVLWRWFNRMAYQRANVVMTLGQHMANHVGQQFDPAKTGAGEIIIIEPWADETKLGIQEKVDNWFAKKYGQTDKMTVMYSGNMGRGHDIESILSAADSLRDRSQISFLLIGAGAKWKTIQAHIDEHQPPNMTLLPWQPEEDLPFTLTTADLGVVSLETELSGLAVPSKAFYFLAAGVPIVAICESNTELADVVYKYGCGRVVAPGNPDGIVRVLHDVLADPSLLKQWNLGARRASERFSRRKMTAKFLSTLRQHLLPAPMATDSEPTASVTPI